MAQKKKSASTMDSIYDFIFSEAQKTPDKVKPVKITGLDATDPYVNIATAVLEQPLMYVNKTTEGAIKGATDIDLGKFQIDFDEKGGGTDVKVRTSNIRDILNNNLTFVDKAFDKLEAVRKAGRVTAWGKDLAAFTAAGMASQLGLDADTRNAFLKVGKSAEDKNAEYEMNIRSVHLAANSWARGNYQNIPEADLKSMYGDGDGAKIYRDLQIINRKYQAEMSKPADTRDFSEVFTEAGNRDMHLLFERANLARKAARARSDATRYAPDSAQARRLNRQAKGYDDAQNVLGVLHDSEKYKETGGMARYLIQKEADLRSLQSELERLSGATDRASVERIRDIGEEIKGINTQVRNFKLQRTAYNLGAMETRLKSIQQIYEYTVGGQFVPALLNGDFFDANKNSVSWLQPRDGESKVKLSYLDKNGKDVGREYSGFLAKQVEERPYLQAYYEDMMDFYYRFTPAGIVENLTKGNGFARQAYKQRESLIAAFEGSSMGRGFTGTVDWNKLFGPGSDDYIDSLRSQPGFAVLVQFYDDNKARFKRCGSLMVTADKFNIVDRTKKWFVGTKFYKNTFGKIRQAVVKSVEKTLLKWAKGDAVAKKLIEKWAGEGSLKGVSVAIKAAVKSFLAGASGGVSAALGFVIDRAVDLAMVLAARAAKPLIKFTISGLTFALVGLIAFLFMIFSPPKTMKTLGSYSHVAPYEIVLGDTDYTVDVGGSSDIPGGPLEEWSGGPALPSGEHCLLGSSSKYNCTQGPGDSFSHSALPNAIDIGFAGTSWDGTFRAPQFCGKGGGTCTIEFYRPYACMGNPMGGGMQALLRAEYKGTTYEFLLVHVILDTKLSAGSTVGAGEPVAVAQVNRPPGENVCWFGRHLHLETKVNGALVSPCDVLTKDPSSGGFGCDLDDCEGGYNPSGHCSD